MKKKLSLKDKIYNFFEHPQGLFPVAYQVIIIVLIILSVGIAFAEFFEHGFVHIYQLQLTILNNFILVVFTLDYFIRLIVAPKKLQFVRKPMNIVDFMS